MIEFKMPSLAADMGAALLVEWFKQPGDRVRRGEVIALAETQQGAVEIEAFDEGVLGEQRVQPGREVPVGTVLATIFNPDEPAPSRRAAKPKKMVAGRPYQRRGSNRLPIAPARSTQRASAAWQRGPGILPLECMPSGLSPGAENAMGFARSQPLYEREPAREKAKRGGHSARSRDAIREATNTALVRSHRDVPHYWITHAIDATPLLDWMEAENARRPAEAQLVYIALLMKAAALALGEVPELNGRYEGGAFRPAPAVHMGLATPLHSGGQAAPTIRDANSKSVDELMRAITDLERRARLGRLRMSEVADGTVTMSNVAEGNADCFFPLIFPPQVAIIGCGTPGARPWAFGNSVVVRRVIPVTIAGDHRVNHARHSAEFLARLSELIRNPQAL